MKTWRIVILSLAIAAVAVSCRGIARRHAENKEAADRPAAVADTEKYAYDTVKAAAYGVGRAQYWIFEPASPAPKEPLPLVIFLHGWGGMNPKPYGAWIKHLVRRGMIVVYPRYQDSLATRPPEMADAALQAVRDAIETLKQPGHATPDLQRFAGVGHSLGGVLTANLAAHSGKDGIPDVRAAMPVEPGDSLNSKTEKLGNGKVQSTFVDLSSVPPDVLLLCVAGDDDNIAGDEAAKKIIADTGAVPAKNKNMVLFHSDSHAGSDLKANHFMPLAVDPDMTKMIGEDEPKEKTGPIREKIRERFKERREERGGDRARAHNSAPDQFDLDGTWRLFDALTDCAFYKKNCGAALGGGQDMLYAGKWPDGTPVKKLSLAK